MESRTQAFHAEKVLLYDHHLSDLQADEVHRQGEVAEAEGAYQHEQDRLRTIEADKAQAEQKKESHIAKSLADQAAVAEAEAELQESRGGASTTDQPLFIGMKKLHTEHNGVVTTMFDSMIDHHENRRVQRAVEAETASKVLSEEKEALRRVQEKIAEVAREKREHLVASGLEVAGVVPFVPEEGGPALEPPGVNEEEPPRSPSPPRPPPEAEMAGMSGQA